MESLLAAAKSYETLMSTRYRILLGKKRSLLPIELSFHVDNFYHLVGLHKLKYLLSTRNSERILKMILSGELTDEMAMAHEKYPEIKDRIALVTNLSEILEGNVRYFEIVHEMYSLIKADLIILGKFNEKDTLYFAIKMINNVYAPVSLFNPEMGHYTENQKEYRALYFDKLNLDTMNLTIIKPCTSTTIDINEYFEFNY